MIIDSEVALRIALEADSENEHLEFKEARNNYEFEKLASYCVALANEGGGHIILGVTNDRPRTIVGTNAFQNLQDIKAKLFTRLRKRIDVYEIMTAAGRVLVFRSPPSPPGHPLDLDGRYLMRIGEQLTAMTGERLREILLRDRGDLSAEVVHGDPLDMLDYSLIQRFRILAAARCKRRGDASALEQAAALERASAVEMLENVHLLMDGKVTSAALLMLGSERSLSRFLPQSELIFEYRSSDQNIDYQERRAYRRGFLGYMDDIWDDISKRNEIQSFQAGLIRHQIPTFSERSVREAVLNAVCHRSYVDQGSVLVRQFPRRLEVISPGGFPAGVTPANILSMSRPRNRLLHEAMERCGLVERSGQGADLMFREAIKSAKPAPSFEGSDSYTVHLTLNGQVRDAGLLGVLEKIQERVQTDIDLPDLRIVDAVYHNENVPSELVSRVGKLVEQGIVERAARGRLVLARNLYAALGKRGVYTRRKGLTHEREKALLLQHIVENNAEGSPMRDLMEAMPALDRFAINALLDELRAEGKVHPRGQRRAARWFSGPYEEELPLKEKLPKKDG
jgi:ATP-dependent DNA helicase RecG